MAIFTPTALFYQAPVVAGGGGGAYIIRTDANASSVTYAAPGTKFDTTFGQSTYRSDISGYINGGSSIGDPALTGSGQTSSATTKWTTAADGYSTSMQKGTNSNNGAIPGTATNVNFGSGNFTIETWFYSAAGGGDMWTVWSYNAGCGFFGWSNAGYYRWVAQNSSFGETLQDYTTTFTTGTWHHIFMSRSGNSWYGGLDGTIRANLTLSGAVGTSAPYQIGGSSGGAGATFLMQDYRITKGVARYTGAVGASYTMPSSIVTKS